MNQLATARMAMATVIVSKARLCFVVFSCPVSMLCVFAAQGDDSRVRPQHASAQGGDVLLYAKAAEIPGPVLSAEIPAGGHSPRVFRIRVFLAYGICYETRRFLVS